MEEKIAFRARNATEMLFQKKIVSGLEVIGAGSTLDALPKKFMSTRSIADLTRLQLHERYLDIGSGATLGQLERLGERCPKVLRDAVKSVANPYLRNVITVGGNIAAREVSLPLPRDSWQEDYFPPNFDNERQNVQVVNFETGEVSPKGIPTDLNKKKKTAMRLTLFAPLMALDSQIALQSPTNTTLVPLQKLSEIPKNYVITNIRLPRNEWDIELFARTGPCSVVTAISSSYAFLTALNKGTISNIRICFSGAVTFRATSLENRLLGVRVPLTKSSFSSYLTEAKNLFDLVAGKSSSTERLRDDFLRLFEWSLRQLF